MQMSGSPTASPLTQAPAAASAFGAPSPQLAKQELNENFRINFQGKVRLECMYLAFSFCSFSEHKRYDLLLKDYYIVLTSLFRNSKGYSVSCDVHHFPLSGFRNVRKDTKMD